VPKIVDHEERRDFYVDALFRLIERKGFTAISLRALAEEASTPKSTLLYYFDNEAGLLSAAMNRITSDAVRDIDASLAITIDNESIVAGALRAIPVSAHRRAESEIWIHLLRVASRDPAAARVLHQANLRLDQEISAILEVVADAGLLADGVDLATEVQLFHALIDGLSLRTMTDPSSITNEVIEAAIRAHVGRLIAPI
jgi:DNA-binding transcriptional regulator YbjK